MPIRAMAICFGLLAVVPAAAQTGYPIQEVQPSPPAAPPGEGDDPRYSFNRVQDGYLRLDLRTGQVSLCSRRQVGWACQAIPDDRAVLEGEITRLQAENGKLKKELLSRGLSLPSGVSAAKPAGPREAETKSTDSELNKVRTLVETMWYRLVEMIANLQRDLMKKT